MMLRTAATPSVLRIGAAAAILGAVVSVVAGIGFGGLTAIPGIGSDAVLGVIAARPPWFWPLVHLGFITGAFLWVVAFVVIALTVLDRPASAVLGLLAVAAVVVGAAAHVVDSSISAVALSGSAAEGRSSGAAVVLLVLGGTWAAVITFFHGLPFVLLGSGMAASDRYPAWLGWIGVLGGGGSIVTGLALFFRLGWPTTGFIAFAVLLSLWMVAVGVALWRLASQPQAEAAGERMGGENQSLARPGAEPR